MLKRLLWYLDDLLFPQHVLCICCGNALGDDEQNEVCPACMKALSELAQRQAEREARQKDRFPEHISYVHAAFVYEAQARKLVHALKYEGIRKAAVTLAAEMAMLPSGEEELIVPVPTDKRRERDRGYNQATLLANEIGRTLGMPVSEPLMRIRHCAPQTGQSLKRRQKNLVGCMRADRSVTGKRILLVDDVYTSGSTVREAARALIEAGALSVGVFAAAQAGTDSARKPAFFIW